MKILQLGKFYPVKGGVEKVMYDLMYGLSSEGVKCDMMCAAVDGNTRIEKINENAKLIVCHSWFKAAATMISPAMIAELRKKCSDYDIIHIHHPDPMACLALFLSDFKGKVVLHWHSDILKQRFLLNFFLPLQRWLIKRADYIVGTSPVYLSKSPYLKSVEEKTLCIPIGVPRMKPDEHGVRRIKERYHGKKIIFSLGRLIEYKGFTYLIGAASFLDDGYVILIGGEGELKDELQLQIDRNGLESKVKLLGRIEDKDLPDYYGACDLFCLSSVQKTEAFGIVQVEAMSCGKPIIATNIPGSGVSWVNADGVSGINVPPGDSKAIADAVMTITYNAKIYNEFCRCATERYENFFTQKKMIYGNINIYEKLCKKTH